MKRCSFQALVHIEVLLAGLLALGPVGVSAAATRVDAAVGEINALREAVKFVEARDAVRKAIQQYASEPDVKKLRDIELVLRNEVRDFIKLQADIEQLNAREAAARRVAVEHLLVEDVGKVVLRKTVREGSVPAAVAAGRGLAETKDAAGIQAVLARAKSEKDAVGATELLAILPDVSKFIALSEIPALVSWASDKAPSVSAPLRDLIRRRAVGSLDAAELKTVADMALGPDSPARRGAMEFVVEAFKSNARRDAGAFDKLFGESRYAGLFAALEKDRTAEDVSLAEWAGQQWLAMLRIDADALAKGLYARWTLDAVSQGRLNDSGPTGGRDLIAKNLDGRSLLPGLFKKALACTNENIAVEWGSRNYRDLQTNDFSLSVWVRAFAFDPGRGDPESLILGSEVQNGRTSGLVLGTNGVLNFYLPIMVQPPPPANDPKKKPGRRTLDYVKVTASKPIAASAWCHVAAAVSRRSNAVTLYLNGRPSGRAAADTNAIPGDVAGPLRVGGARSPTKDRRVSCVFQGLLDDIRIYDREITETDAAMLFAEGDQE